MTTPSHIAEQGKHVQFLTALFALLGLMVPKAEVEGFLPLVGFALILAGVPHGAGDYLLSKQLKALSGRVFSPVRYLSGYLLLVAVYLLVWVWAPLLAFGFFLLLSAYHFGQSNWVHISFPSKTAEKATLLCWGLGIIGIPVLLHFEQASTIISEMTGSSPHLPDVWRALLVFLLVFSNLGVIVQLYHRRVITAKTFGQELWKFLLLLLLFFTTPLLVGFGVYFVLWHSLDSTRHQVAVLRSMRPGFGFRQYLWQALPLTLLAYAGLGALYFQFGEVLDRGQNMGALFLFIAVITVPHALLMEWLYRVGKPLLAVPEKPAGGMEAPAQMVESQFFNSPYSDLCAPAHKPPKFLGPTKGPCEKI